MARGTLGQSGCGGRRQIRRGFRGGCGGRRQIRRGNRVGFGFAGPPPLLLLFPFILAQNNTPSIERVLGPKLQGHSRAESSSLIIIMCWIRSIIFCISTGNSRIQQQRFQLLLCFSTGCAAAFLAAAFSCCCFSCCCLSHSLNEVPPLQTL